ncbi:Cro/CI family transcriptional regulator [Paraburkholderia phytofirmans]|uniref:Cro/CI family transcriptional regulator n=1 Tax=Paraburkholderia phytofirmans TaxID=261302 RepID=UPI000A056175
MTKSELVDRAGGVRRLAAILRVSSQAVSRWPNDGVPPLRLYQLRERRPEWFEEPSGHVTATSLQDAEHC